MRILNTSLIMIALTTTASAQQVRLGARLGW